MIVLLFEMLQKQNLLLLAFIFPLIRVMSCVPDYAKYSLGWPSGILMTLKRLIKIKKLSLSQASFT